MKSGATDPRVATILLLIETEPSTGNRTIATLADQVNLSTSRLAHLFKSTVGISLGTYLRRDRIERAKKLLIYSALSIKQIASLLSFSDGHHFCRSFNQIVGFSPKMYREKIAETGT